LGKLIYEGKSKKVYEMDAHTLILEFKDEVTAFDGKYKDFVESKGILSARLSSKIFELLEDHGIKTHYICYLGGRLMKVKRCEAIPLEVIVRNYAYGSFLKRMPLLQKLKKFSSPLVEFHFKSDELHDPLLLEQDIIEAGVLSSNDLKKVKDVALRVNEVLSKFWAEKGLTLIDFKIEVGRDLKTNEIVVIDDLSGDSMRVITSDGRHLDKEVYRRTRDISLLINAYKELAEIAGEPTKLCRGGTS
jgi:phosphoribosylaminoimidazole-succinocarboxamide synthase